MQKTELFKRYLIAAVGLFIMSLGIALLARAGLGSSPISAVPNVLFLRFPQLTLGTYLLFMNSFLILLQILLLRRNFQWIQLLQLPLSILFKYFTDIAYSLTAFFPVSNYGLQFLSMLIGILVLAFGIALMVAANVIMNCGEALVQAIVIKTRGDFGKLKVAVDVTLALSAAILSLILFHGLQGVREGTVFSSVCTGFIVRWILPKMKPLIKWFSHSKKQTAL